VAKRGDLLDRHPSVLGEDVVVDLLEPGLMSAMAVVLAGWVS
jgi:hypothetical protein